VPQSDPEDDPAEAGDTAAPDARASPREAVTVIVAREREGLDADVSRLKLTVAALAVALVGALAGLTQMALRVGLRSLEGLARQLRALDMGFLARRIEVAAPPEEIAVVVEQVNALLDRLEAGLTRERRLSSDIAHELKTPIAELRNLCEIGARWPEDRVAVRAFFADAGAIALQMERIVAHLVALARYDEGREPVLAAPVPVAEVVDAAWKHLAPAAAARGLEFRQEISPGLRFHTDPDTLTLILANILSNAVDHSPPGAAVVCTSEESDGGVSVTVSNRAADLEPDDLAVMFDRFWRKDEARGGGRHAGLGLSLVRAMADALAIRITTRLEPDRTFRITLAQPRGA
jgi:signal transduction histidine kinase